ncbi:ABC-type sugar transport system, auxiliary component [Enterobacter cloacae]|uniref:D-lyxose ketol-isomerase n=1 Tax=Enterobacter cloacae TaxID=550 RepID=A0A377LQ24_ENTCL|nr:ABC-type sugar transport system, auxiliary component [Enterobacter cloacae]
MKRSEINEILGHTRQFFSMHDVHLPPFCQLPTHKMATARSGRLAGSV